MGMWNSPRGDSLSHLKFVLNCHTGFSRPLCSINKRYLEQENENSETSKFISICHRTESCLCVVNYMSCCFSVSFALDYDICHVSESCSKNMPSENLIKEPITSEGDPTTKSQNHGALHVEGKLGNYILISGFISRMREFSLAHKQQLDTKREM